MHRVTLDTNVLISGSFWTGDSFRIIELIDKKEVFCVLSNELIAEYNRTINSEEIMDKIENKSLILSNVVQKVIIDSEIVEPKIKLDIIRDDPSDNLVIECAKEGNAGFIITNDNHLLKLKEFDSIKIMTPKEFLKRFRRDKHVEPTY